jgi:RDD family
MSNRPDVPGRADWYGISNLAGGRAVGWRVDAGDGPAIVVVDSSGEVEQEERVEHQAPGERAALAYLGAQAWRGLHLATWRQRAVAWLADVLIWLALSMPGAAIAWVGGGGRGAVVLGVLLLAAAAVVALWQAGWRQGRQGQSWGKQLRGLYVVRASDGQLLGGPRGLARCLGRVALFATVVLQVPSYLWPLRDAKHQTWEDKVAGSVVTAGR